MGGRPEPMAVLRTGSITGTGALLQLAPGLADHSFAPCCKNERGAMQHDWPPYRIAPRDRFRLFQAAVFVSGAAARWDLKARVSATANSIAGPAHWFRSAPKPAFTPAWVT